jgi:hypothetical protein
LKVQKNPRSRELSGVSLEEKVLWILLYADDIAHMSDDLDKMRDMVAALDLAFPAWGLLISIAKTKTTTVRVPMPGEGPVSVLAIFIDNKRVAYVENLNMWKSIWRRSLPQTTKLGGKSVEGWH